VSKRTANGAFRSRLVQRLGPVSANSTEPPAGTDAGPRSTIRPCTPATAGVAGAADVEDDAGGGSLVDEAVTAPPWLSSAAFSAVSWFSAAPGVAEGARSWATPIMPALTTGTARTIAMRRVTG
jgi:hypothetical protein